MPPPLSSADRIAMSRRLVKLPNELSAFGQSKTNATSAVGTFGQTDDMNAVLFDWYHAIAGAYEGERQALNGVVAASFVEADIVSSANEATGNIFFPVVTSGPTPGIPNAPFLIPGAVDTTNPPDGVSDGMVDAVNGVAASQDASWEQSLLSNPPAPPANSGDGLTEIIDILQNGFSGAVGTNTDLSADYVVGSGTMSVVSGVNIADGEWVIAQKEGGGISGLFLVTAGGGTATLTVHEIVPPSGNIVAPVPPNDTDVTNTFVGFTNTERTNLVATVDGDFQDVLDGLTTAGPHAMLGKVTTWEGKLDTQATALSGNDEERAVQQGENTTADTNITATKGVIDTWQALGNTGAGGKFTDAGLGPVSTEIASRSGEVTTRLTEISGALGLVTDDGDGTFSVSNELDIYPQRYKMVNARINRAFGSLKRKIGSEKNTGTLQAIEDLLTDQQEEYVTRMVATRLSANPSDSREVTVDDGSGFAVGDTVFVVSEGQSELTGTIRLIDDVKIVLSFTVSSAYVRDDLVRLYKVL